MSCIDFLPEINASQLTLNVSGPSNSISGAIVTQFLSASTDNGNMTVQDVDFGNTSLYLENLNAGDAQIQLDAAGSMYSLGTITAGAVDLNATGSGSVIFATTQVGEITATTSDGYVAIDNISTAPLTVEAVTADSGGQGPTVNDDQVEFNDNPNGVYYSNYSTDSNTENSYALATPNDVSGPGPFTVYTSTGSTLTFYASDCSISSPGPILLNSISATGDLTVSSEYIVEGNGPSQAIVAQNVSLTATGAALHQGQVQFADGNGTIGGDTLTLPAGTDWTSFGFSAPAVVHSLSVNFSGDTITSSGNWPQGFAAGDQITVSGAANAANDGTFIIQSISGTTLIVAAGSVNVFETDSGDTAVTITVDDSIIVSGATETANDGTFTIASISNNTLTLQQSYVLDPETEANVTVGDGMIGLTTPPDSGNTASYPIYLAKTDSFTAATTNGNVFLSLGSSVDSTAVSVTAGGMGNVSLSSSANYLTIENITANGNTVADGTTVIGGAVAVAMSGGALLEYPSNYGTSNQHPGIINAVGISLSSPLSIGSASSPLLTNATSLLMVSATATSPSEGDIYVDNTANLASVQAGTDDGTVLIEDNQGTGGAFAGDLSFDNNVLSETGSAVVSFANTDANNGSADNVELTGLINVSSITAGGQILAENSQTEIYGQTVMLSAGNGIGTPSNSIDTDVTTLVAMTGTGSVYINQNAPPAAGTITANATVTYTTSATNGSITSVSSVSGGSAYPSNSTFDLLVTGGGGTGGVVQVTTGLNGAITGFALVDGGSGYTGTSASTSVPQTAGTGAAVAITTYNGAITSVTLPTTGAGGSGYPANSTFCLMVTGGGGTGGVVPAATNSSGIITSVASSPRRRRRLRKHERPRPRLPRSCC